MSQEQLIKNLKDCKLDGDNVAHDQMTKSTSNERAGLVGHASARDVAASQMESIGVQVVKQQQQQQQQSESICGGSPQQPIAGQQKGEITIGEALEATALTSGHLPVDYSDAAAIQAAEVRATGRTNIVPGGVAAAAQSAATRNARLPRDEDKTKLGDILTDASAKLPSDKPVTRKDAEGVIGAELRNDPDLCTRPGGVAASIAAAARLNQRNSQANNNNSKLN
ncbi:Seed maturation protein [Striga hermonthica]|uniref:Seed maturation protein n=1 Tax=Striga hermonthica TaxID=68872 RepID=A0A9N7NK25_STRHE|nr:Seed maturation protein [Striga hermonthica]